MNLVFDVAGRTGDAQEKLIPILCWDQVSVLFSNQPENQPEQYKSVRIEIVAGEPVQVVVERYVADAAGKPVYTWKGDHKELLTRVDKYNVEVPSTSEGQDRKDTQNIYLKLWEIAGFESHS